ncbi:MAG: DNA topoisomerase (ATP-hydrolyzing), partial [Patescibacteria group bacterium]|nr:DNA topoisomerase (ATP-hydrolyzing) [Patescibacteria group bacterium]
MEQVQKRDITEELTESYLDYAMSVIISRALPDVRDGLKPVQRRILFAMYEMGLSAGARFRKSATVVGETLGKYHPHGDIPVYDAMVRMAQDFSLRYPLIQGQGNFGSIDGDAAAAHRYTEAKLSRLAEEMLADIEKNTVNFRDNFDATKKEPVVLPSKIPQLLLNGTVGIAVGMATNIPPHNLGEIVDALNHLADHPNATIEDLMQFIQGPDFPGGAMIFDKKAILETYATGRGPILTRGTVEIVESKKSETQIIVSEIPFQISKSALIEKMAELVQDKKIEGVRDMRDESDKEGMRIVLYLKSDAYPQKIINALYKYTELERAYHVNLLALSEGVQPEVLSLKTLLEQFLTHRKIVVRRRTEFDLSRARERAHILEGLVRALDAIDAVIKTIRQSKDREQARANLIKRFEFTEIQANAILDMRLSTLANLEQEKIKAELEEKRTLIRELSALLENPNKMLAIIKEEFSELKAKYGDARRTKVRVGSPREIEIEDIIPEEEAVVVLTRGGYIKRMNPDIYRSQHRGGKGVIGVTPREEDVVEHFVTANTHANLLFFTNAGKVYQTKVYEIPDGTRQSRGKPLAGFLQV